MGQETKPFLTGCCFVKYATSDEADRAIRALHNQYTLPGVGTIPIYCVPLMMCFSCLQSRCTFEAILLFVV